MINKGQMSYLLKLNSISNRDEAEDMKGTTMLVKSNEREQLDRDSEFYVQDLAGLEVRLKVSLAHTHTHTHTTEVTLKS